MKSPLFIRRVVGHSMEPTLHEGNVLLVRRTRRFKVGQVVVASTGERSVVKRITQIGHGRATLVGDKSGRQHDSGFVELSAVDGKVIWPRLKRR